ncbi:MAG: transporter [Gemmatimonadota bacterium]|nr:transporter [Gemmatimonadota bacterium]
MPIHRPFARVRAAHLLALLVAFRCAPSSIATQELVPAAFTPAPTGLSLASIATVYSEGELSFDPSSPIEDASAWVWGTAFTYARTFSLLGRSANITATLPVAMGRASGKYLGEPAEAYRFGVADPGLRAAVNLLGAPAMDRPQFAARRPSTMLGASLAVRAPLGQYDSEKLINIGRNQWAFKPQLGFVQPIGPVTLDAYVGGWFYTTNGDFFGGRVRSQAPILSTELHVRYDFGGGRWVSFDANFWRGGRHTVDGVEGADIQRESRIGGTYVAPLAPGHSLRIAGSFGAVNRIGGDFTSIGLAYVFTWF